MKALLRYREKNILQGRYLIEMTIHEVNDRARYNDGIKYGLICFDLATKKKVIMDNHHPKKDHIHVDDTEYSYKFRGIDQLLEDFKSLILKHFGEIL